MNKLLLDKSHAQRITVLFTAVGLYCSNDHHNQIKYAYNKQQGKTNNDQCEKERDKGIDGYGYLKVKGLLTLIVYERGFILLDQPYNEGSKQMTDCGDDIHPKTAQVTEHRP